MPVTSHCAFRLLCYTLGMITEESLKRILSETLQQEVVIPLERKIDDFKEFVVDHFERLYEGQAELSEKFDRMSVDMDLVKADLGVVKADIVIIKADIKEIKADARKIDRRVEKLEHPYEYA